MLYPYNQMERHALLQALKYAYIGKSECQTIQDYLSQYFYSDDRPYNGEFGEHCAVEIPDDVLEIISDEMNHCMISLFAIAKLLDIKIPTDRFPEDLPLKS